MTTLKEAIKAIQSLKAPAYRRGRHSRSAISKTSICNRLLGKYKGVIPKGKNATAVIRELRNSLYLNDQN